MTLHQGRRKHIPPSWGKRKIIIESKVCGFERGYILYIYIYVMLVTRRVMNKERLGDQNVRWKKRSTKIALVASSRVGNRWMCRISKSYVALKPKRTITVGKYPSFARKQGPHRKEIMGFFCKKCIASHVSKKGNILKQKGWFKLPNHKTIKNWIGFYQRTPK